MGENIKEYNLTFVLVFISFMCFIVTFVEMR